MKNIWSENKYVNIVVNVMLFLMATNFLHFGYFILPIICLVIFIDKKFKFYVNNKKAFILLCIFGLTFLLFSYKLGFYSLFGLFLPTAYYIGSNSNIKDEDDIKRIIYLFAFGMAVHVVLNFAYDFAIRGMSIFNKKSHLDFWMLGEGSPTQTAVNYVFMIALIYYVFVYENNKKIKALFISLLTLMFIYEIALARRTPILLIGVSIISSIFIDKLLNKNNNKKINYFIYTIIILVLLVTALLIYYMNNIYNPWSYDNSISIINRFYSYSFDLSRLEILMDAFKIAPQHLWGGQEISTLFDINVHDLWMDTYDYAGIFPYLLLVTYSIYCLVIVIRSLKNTNISKSFRLLIFELFICIMIQMLLEPIITGSPVFLLCTIIVIGLIECLILKKV